jgi:hypothetical protein
MRLAKGRPKIGDERTVLKFLFFPRCFHGEWRWLELAIIRQKWEIRRGDSLDAAAAECGHRIDTEGWWSVAWAN